MRKQVLCITIPICICILIAGAWLADAGPPDLNPPPGPVGVSGRFGTRTAISSLPFTIDKCGSYFLTECLTGATGLDGITISADDVTLDLNGFALIGAAGSLRGIRVTVPDHFNISIQNGTVRDWGGDGVDAAGAFNSLLRNLRAYNNGGRGMSLADGGTISTCDAYNNGGLAAIVAGSDSTITDCTARVNTSGGIFTVNGSAITGCTARGNGGDGINAGEASTITGCTTRNNVGDGIVVSAGSTVVNCAARANTNDGIDASTDSTVIGCTATSNGDDGITVTGGSTVTQCTASVNTGDGIEAGDNCHVVNNSCIANGQGDGSGIHVTGSDNRIEANNAIGNDRGLDVDGTGNIIIKNTASGNTDAGAPPLPDFVITPNNLFGTILNLPSPPGGDIGASTVQPWANFRF